MSRRARVCGLLLTVIFMACDIEKLAQLPDVTITIHSDVKFYGGLGTEGHAEGAEGAGAVCTVQVP